MEVDAVLHFLVQVFKDNEVDVSAEMAHGCIQKLELVLHAESLDFRSCSAVELGAFAAMGHVDMVHILHEFGGLLLSDILVKRSAEIICDVVLAVGECACTSETAHD